MPALTCQIHTLYDTQHLADGVAVWLAACGHSYQTLCLSGDLGAGKSEFCRQLLKSYYQDMTLEVPSPTFTLVQTYSPDEQSGGCAECWHMDLYRLNDADEIWALGLEQALSTAHCLIEWPEKIAPFLEDDILIPHRLEIYICHDDTAPDARRVSITCRSSEPLEHLYRCCTTLSGCPHLEMHSDEG